ncbi:hypothetical protein [Streptosporangium sandarakinum]|uniref:hypothetical protein n=1 Tax=Streptosporangium sandarakinum TaxID=1260955 RepID=UPI003435B755
MPYRYFGMAGTRAVRVDRMPDPPSAGVPERRNSLSGLFDEQLTSGAVTTVR